MTFVVDGQLRSIEGDKPFVFEVKKGDSKFNQANYEALGEVSESKWLSILLLASKPVSRKLYH